MGRKRFYVLYASHPGGVKSSYYSGDYILRVRATSIKQAYALVGKRIRANGTDVGVVSVRNSRMSDASAASKFFGGERGVHGPEAPGGHEGLQAKEV